ncbi:MAG: hypothetical protein ACR2H2_09780, partial [Solirubrobacteraceae bacterium]
MKDDEAPGAVLRDDGGVPSVSNPSVSLALPGAVPLGVPNFFIEKFRIPPFLLGIYQAAGVEYGVRWEVLAAINDPSSTVGIVLDLWKAIISRGFAAAGVSGRVTRFGDFAGSGR